MSQPIPTGTRDVLPEEMRELRAIESTLGNLFEARGYGEVATPTIEYHEVLEQGDPQAPAAFRFFDETGTTLAMRTDMTIPIARLVANRFAGEEGPFRLRYSGRAYRPVTPQRGQLREFRQVGIELLGEPEPGGTIEIVELLVAALDAIGLERAVVGLGDAMLYRQLLDEMEVDGPARDRILDCLIAHDLVAIEAEAGDLADLGDAERGAIVALANLRGGPDVLERARSIGGEAVERASARLAETVEGLSPEAAGRVQVDLGLLRDLDYYSGAILQVYDPALAHPLGGGGRYDELLGRFGRPMPAAGFALYLERAHVAQAQQARAGGPR